MNTLTWYRRLAHDPHVLAISTALRDGRTWVYCEARSARACAQLRRYLEQHNAAHVAPKGRTALWLEEERA